jgi:hypothetical protein
LLFWADSVRKLIYITLLFVMIWLAYTLQTLNDARYNPDLGISTDKLQFGGALIWSLPIALVTWLLTMALIKLTFWIARKIGRKPQ